MVISLAIAVTNIRMVLAAEHRSEVRMQINKRVAMVTGASRGAGKGIAIALGASGATVYVTGRTRKEGDAPLQVRSRRRQKRSRPPAVSA